MIDLIQSYCDLTSSPASGLCDGIGLGHLINETGPIIGHHYYQPQWLELSMKFTTLYPLINDHKQR